MSDVITPFRIDLSEAAIDDLRERLARSHLERRLAAVTERAGL